MKAEYNISKTIGPDDWRSMRLILDGKEGETEQELMTRVANQVDVWFTQRFFTSFFGPVSVVIPSENINPEDTVAAINSCKELKVLESYKLIAKTNPQYQEAYDTMYQKLSQ